MDDMLLRAKRRGDIVSQIKYAYRMGAVSAACHADALRVNCPIAPRTLPEGVLMSDLSVTKLSDPVLCSLSLSSVEALPPLWEAWDRRAKTRAPTTLDFTPAVSGIAARVFDRPMSRETQAAVSRAINTTVKLKNRLWHDLRYLTSKGRITPEAITAKKSLSAHLDCLGRVLAGYGLWNVSASRILRIMPSWANILVYRVHGVIETSGGTL